MLLASLPQLEFQLILLFSIAAIIAVLMKYIKFPYAITLVIVGLVIGFLGISEIELSKEIIFFLFLPPLLFEGAINIEFSKLKENFRPILVLAFPGMIAAIFAAGLIINWLTGIPLIYTLLFGAIIMPTDPVSVLAVFKELGVPKRLKMIVEGESLFNDGTSVVMFTALLAIIETDVFSIQSTILNLIISSAGGLVFGLVTGYLAIKLLEKIDEPSIEVLITIVLAYATFLFAENYLNVSGVFAVLAAGLFIGNKGKQFAMSPSTRIANATFWDIIVFIVNTLIFIMIGTKIPVYLLTSHLAIIGIAIFAVLIARMINVYPFLFILRWFKEKIPLKWQHVINWGGMHGSLPIALLLGLPKIAYYEQLSLMVYGVVFFSLIAQGLTITGLIKRLKISSVSKLQEEYELDSVNNQAIKEARKTLTELLKKGEISHVIHNQLDKSLQDSEHILEEKLQKHLSGELVRSKQYKLAKRKILLAKKDTIQTATSKGYISTENGFLLIKNIDEELEGIEEQ
jgi:monovalent cation:H+ antiporter, CPA1 family